MHHITNKYFNDIGRNAFKPIDVNQITNRLAGTMEDAEAFIEANDMAQAAESLGDAFQLASLLAETQEEDVA